MGILPPIDVTEIAAVQERVTAAVETKMLGCARRKVNAGENGGEPEESVIAEWDMHRKMDTGAKPWALLPKHAR
jgi:hypothetical protein